MDARSNIKIFARTPSRSRVFSKPTSGRVRPALQAEMNFTHMARNVLSLDAGPTTSPTTLHNEISAHASDTMFGEMARHVLPTNRFLARGRIFHYPLACSRSTRHSSKGTRKSSKTFGRDIVGNRELSQGLLGTFQTSGPQS